MPKHVLHLLSQRPGMTGSGITLLSMVQHAKQKGWKQMVSIGIPSGDVPPAILSENDVNGVPLIFGTDALPFPVPGMSDVMPYESTRFSSMTESMLMDYRAAWRMQLERLKHSGPFDVIHTHHLWVMSSLVKEVFPETPVVNHCHGTGLRQMDLCPNLAPEIIAKCRQHEAFAVLHDAHKATLVEKLSVAPEKVYIVGAGYREDLFYPEPRKTDERRLLYAGKFSNAKGLPELLEAFRPIAKSNPQFSLHLAGSGTGSEEAAIKKTIEELGASVIDHGRLEQPELAALMRQAHTFVLPSYFEGLPLVLVEALASGARLVSNNLPGVVETLAPTLGDGLKLVEMPPLTGPDTPKEECLPAYIERLTTALLESLNAPPLNFKKDSEPSKLAPFQWGTVFSRVESIWNAQIRFRTRRG